MKFNPWIELELDKKIRLTIHNGIQMLSPKACASEDLNCIRNRCQFADTLIDLQISPLRELELSFVHVIILLINPTLQPFS